MKRLRIEMEDVKAMGIERNNYILYHLYFTCEYELHDYLEFIELSLCNKQIEHTASFLIMQESKRNIIIAFTHMFLEAFIYDFCADNYSDTYTKNYIDKLDFLSKWVVISKMVTGKDFPTDSQAFELLTKINKSRNKLIHFKTEKMSEKAFYKILDSQKISVSDCFECMSEALLEIKKLGEDKSQMYQWAFIQKIINKSYKKIWDEHVKKTREIVGIVIDENNQYSALKHLKLI